MGETANLSIAEIAARVAEWSGRNFPNNTPLEPLEGIVEETGELARARLKRRQGIRGTAEEHIAAERDAIGDIAIYTLDFATRAGVQLYDVPFAAWNPDKERSASIFLSLAYSVGCLSMAWERRSDIAWEVEQILIGLHRYSAARGWDFLDILNETWAHVAKRDWVADPVAATTGA